MFSGGRYKRLTALPAVRVRTGTHTDLCLRWVPPYPPGGGGWVGLWPVGGWVTLVLGNLAQSAYSPPGGGLGSGWVGGWVCNLDGPDTATG